MRLIIFFLIVLGMFIGRSVIILLLHADIPAPGSRTLGVDPVQFGLVFCGRSPGQRSLPPIGLSCIARHLFDHGPVGQGMD
jgi:TRAP-type C4-dicarboxylate transport system permease large subunit